MRASFVCLRKVSKVGSACSGKWSLRVRIVVVSRKNYDKNSPGYIAQGSSYRNNIFSTQISLELLTERPGGISTDGALPATAIIRATQGDAIATPTLTIGGSSSGTGYLTRLRPL